LPRDQYEILSAHGKHSGMLTALSRSSTNKNGMKRAMRPPLPINFSLTNRKPFAPWPVSFPAQGKATPSVSGKISLP
jgi:hypothetical protein